MLTWLFELFNIKEKYPVKINDKVTKTGSSSYLVGAPKPYEPAKPLDGYTIYIKETEMNTEQLQTQLMQAVAYHFDKDAVRPGVVTSSLRNGKIYASVVRYGKQFSGGKQVVAKAQGTELKEVLTTLSTEFLTAVASKPSPVEALKQLVSDKKKV
jgi:hypothetical protein